MPAAPSLTTIVTAAQSQVSSDLAGEKVILGLHDGIYYGLDGVGARVWELLREPRSVGELRDTILAQYDVDSKQCERDLLTLLGDLAARGLIDLRDEAGSPSPAMADA